MKGVHCMKTLKQSARLCAIAVLMVFVFTGCNDGNDTGKEIPVTGVGLSETEFGLKLGEEETLTANVQPANATNKNVIWSISPSGFASVDNNGTVKAKAVGTAIITVITDDGRKQAVCKVNVGNVSVASVALNKTTLTLGVGTSETLIPTVLPANAANDRVWWESTDKGKATVNADGMVTGVGVGRTTIIVITKSGEKRAECEVTVTPLAVTSVELDTTKLEMGKGVRIRLYPTVLPENASDKGVTWESDDDDVATVNSRGFVTGVGYGKANITVKTVDGSNKTATCAVTVVMPSVPMIWIEPGTFTMGSPAGEQYRENNETEHSVTLTKGFYMGAYHVTQAQYKAVTGINPSDFNVENKEDESAFFDLWPVDTVSWYDAVEFCNKLSEIEELTPVYTISGRTPASGYPITSATVTWNEAANGYRLPTEAEWEYACRAGTETPFNFWNEGTKKWGNDTCPVEWANTNSWYGNSLHGLSFEDYPNQWGLYNMHGNMGEWCWDWFADDNTTVLTDPRGPASGTERVMRGGAYSTDWPKVRSAFRDHVPPGDKCFYMYIPGIPFLGIQEQHVYGYIYGFRVVRGGEPPTK
jgi:uncharacterized protein YjdB